MPFKIIVVVDGMDDLNRFFLTYHYFGGPMPQCHRYQLFLCLKACVVTYLRAAAVIMVAQRWCLHHVHKCLHHVHTCY